MITIDSVDITAVIEAQRNWLCELQKAAPANPILIKAIEGGMPKGADPDLYNWVDHGKVGGKIRSPIYTRGILLNEILIDPDSENWNDVRDGIRKLRIFCTENDIPHLMGFSGGKGIHFSIIFGQITAGDKESSEELFTQVEKYNVDAYKTVRRALLFEIAKRANVDLEKIGMDKKKINFRVTRMGSQVREFGTFRAPGKYKTLITEIPNEKPEPYELPLVFPEKVEVWNIKNTEYYGIAIDAIKNAIEKEKNADEYTPISDENFKDIPILKFPCIDKLFKVGIRNGRYYAAVATVLMCHKCGISKDETKKHLTTLCKTFPGITQEETDTRINNALEMHGKEYHFSCTSIKETFPEHNLCNFSQCPIKEKIEEAKPKNDESDPFTVDNLYPFTVDETGIHKTEYVFNKSLDEPGKKTIRLSTTPCVITAIGENLDNGEILYKLKIKDNKHREKIIWKTTTDLMLKGSVTKLLKEGMHFKEADVTKIIEYFDTSIATNKDTLPSEIAASVSGWKNDFSLFVVGNKGISANGEIEVLSQDNPTAELYTQKGELVKWVQATNKLIKYPAVRFKLYTACVPPLLKLLNIKSFVETQQTPSGRLKTTMGLHGASIWGNPERLQLNAESTAVGILKTVEFCTDLPIFVDETSITDKIKDLVYLVANGVGRSKGNTDGGLVMPSTWSTVLLTTGEKPILPESALTGQQVRVLPLRDGVTEKLPALTVKEIQNGIATNYGHVGVLFIQELFKEKENLISLFNSFFDDFPEVEDITSDRAKEYYAAVALAGYLLEIVFEKIGVTTQESSIVCKKYFTDNVISNSFMPDHIKALSVAYSWFNANEVYFQNEDDDHPLNHERYGWVRNDKNHGSCICFIPDKLSKYLNTEIGPNTYEAVTDEWKALKILIPKEQTDKTGAITLTMSHSTHLFHRNL